MKVQRLTLRNFRNIHETSFEPDPRLNFLVGANGQGKTSIIEALGYLSTLRSFRGSKTYEVIRYGETGAEISCVVIPTGDVDRTNGFQSLTSTDPTTNWGYVDKIGDKSVDLSAWKTEFKIAFSRPDPHQLKASKTAFINGKSFRSSTQYLSQRFGDLELGFHSIVFNPSDHDLVRGDPSERRAYIDRVLAAEDVGYLKTLQKYHRVLEQRNALLKEGHRPSGALLLGFTEQLCAHAIQITRKRLEWIKSLSERLDIAVRKITFNQPFLRLVYVSGWAPAIENLSISNAHLDSIHFAGHGLLPSLELLEQEFWRKASTLEEAEWRAGHTLVGPHRDDWAFFQGSQILKGHGSQGEIRSALLALKLCEIELFRLKTGHRPLFLLDDFSSELDRNRRSFLLDYLSGSDLQVFVTTTDESILAGKTYWVSNGTLADKPTDKNAENQKEKSPHEHGVAESNRIGSE